MTINIRLRFLCASLVVFSCSYVFFFSSASAQDTIAPGFDLYQVGGFTSSQFLDVPVESFPIGEFDFGRSVGPIAEFVFEPLKLQVVDVAVYLETRH